MNEDDKIYHGIGQLLLDAAPHGAKEVIVAAEVSQSNDHCKLLFDYIDTSNKKQWFMPDNATTDSEILDLLVKLKTYFESNNLYKEGEPWKSCTMSLSLETMKIKIDFTY